MRFTPEEIADLAHAELTLGADPEGWRRFWRRSVELTRSGPHDEPPQGGSEAGTPGGGEEEEDGCACGQCSPGGESALNAALARMLDPDSGAARPAVAPEAILDMTARSFGFSVDELRGNDRRRALVDARHIGMYVVRQLTGLSYPAIGREFGGRDHSTVMYAVERISRLMGERREVFEQTTQLLHRVQRGER